MAKNKEKSKSTDKELVLIKQIKDFKRICEANIVSILWKDTEMYYTYDNLNLESFMHNEWKVYWQIGYDIVIKENKPSLDATTVGLYLEKHPNLREKYDEYGGFKTIENAKEYIKIENMSGYVKELYKWNTVFDLLKNKFPIEDRLKEFVDMSLDDIYNEYEAILNHVFTNVEGEDEKTYDISDGIYELIDELDEGLAIGLPYDNCDLLNKETGGSLLGNITLVGGTSGVGKSTFIRNTVVPSVLKYEETILIMINEEGLKKWQRELIIWVANNIYKSDLQKYKLRDGKYSDELKTFLKEKCAKWVVEHKNIIKIRPFKNFTTDKAIKVMKKYIHLGVKYFVLDTFKADSDTGGNEQFWLNMQQNMVKINDLIKPENKNVHIWITFQLKKSSANQRHYTQNNIGMATGIIDVASTCIMIRNVLDDEFKGEKKELKVYKLAGKSGKTKIPVDLDKNKHYQIVFIIKNREGSSNDYQIVIEHDLSRNTYKEVGLVTISPDW